MATQEIEEIVWEMDRQSSKKSAGKRASIAPLSGRISPRIDDSKGTSHREFLVHPLEG